MYQTNFTNSQMAQYNMAMNQFSGQNMNPQDKKRTNNNNKPYKKSGQMNNMNQKQMQMLQNMQMNQNSFQNQENWNEENSDTGNLIANQYKMSNNKIKMGAATSTNFMKFDIYNFIIRIVHYNCIPTSNNRPDARKNELSGCY